MQIKKSFVWIGGAVLVFLILLGLFAPSKKEAEAVEVQGLLSAVAIPRSCDIMANGATPNDATDDREAIQATIDACDTVFIPRGTFIVGRSGANFYGIRLTTGKRLYGVNREAAILKQAPGMANSVRLIMVDGNDIVIEDLGLHGDRANQTVNEHRHGTFIQNSTNLIVRNVKSQEFTGDGFYIYLNNTNLTFEGVRGTNNTRNGLTLGAQTSQVTITGSFFTRNNAQQIDSEPGGTQVVSKVTITGCVLDDEGQSLNGIALTLSGDTALTPLGHNWTVSNNVINGAVIAFQIYGATITGNVGINSTTNPCMKFRDRVERVVYANNYCKMTQYPSLGAIAVQGTSASNIATNIVIEGNIVDLSAVADARVMGVYAVGAIGTVVIQNNTLIGPALVDANIAHGGSGVYLRATVVGTPIRWAVVTGNHITNFGRYGISVWGSSTAQLLVLDASNNTFDDTSGTPAMVMGISLNYDGLNAVQNYRTTSNIKYGNVTTMVGNCPGAGCNNL